MRMNSIWQMIPLTMSRKIKQYTKEMKSIAIFLVFVILILSLGMTQETLGRFSRSFMLTGSARAADFDVIITPPKEFWTEQSTSIFEYHFISDIDFQVLDFQVTNNGETDILCEPYINGNITYRVYVEGKVCTEFRVEVNETIDFRLIIAPAGLDTQIRNIEFFIDIRQIEGR